MFKPIGNIGFHCLLGGLFFIALLIAIFPLSTEYRLLRPEMVCVLLIYWIIFTPGRVGLLYAAGLGLIQDVLEGSVWGAHMMALVVVSYVCTLSYRRIQSYSTWHQSLWVFILIGMHQSVANWIQNLQGYGNDVVALVVSTVVSAFCWPLVYFFIMRLRQFYRIY